MERNNLISAPQLNDVASVFAKWEGSLFGSKGDWDGFYRFMTEPSLARSQFLASMSPQLRFEGNVLLSTINCNDNES